MKSGNSARLNLPCSIYTGKPLPAIQGFGVRRLSSGEDNENQTVFR